MGLLLSQPGRLLTRKWGYDSGSHPDSCSDGAILRSVLFGDSNGDFGSGGVETVTANIGGEFPTDEADEENEARPASKEPGPIPAAPSGVSDS